ncbi:MAG TPA: bifunctional hydroxymethylpyrimidine kinase/phosphomethylpyrimidine kinase [Blastocatellia bacterium]|nr:bifunctional hydroxymethylpyrimidine kinase/phosphomethylpyrimidine kinase [Blastocatellia bacterium]
MKTVLVIAGYDPSGGAGVLADIKTLAAFGCYGAAAVTSLTYQNTTGVFGASDASGHVLESQLRPIVDDFTIAAVKTGMLPHADAINTAATVISDLGNVPVVVDPVVRSTSGYDLISDDALAALVTGLFPRATVVTPNVVEAERIVGFPVQSAADMERAARRLVELGAHAALVTGGHLDLDGLAVDVLFDGNGMHTFSDRRVDSTSTHGTGCTLASAIAAGLALDRPLPVAVAAAKTYVTTAIRSAPGLGAGHGPLDHFPFLEKP